MKLHLGLTTAVATFLWATALFAATPYDPTNDLMSAFGEGCSINGTYTTTSLKHSEAIKSIVASMTDEKNPCYSLKSNLLALVSSAQNIEMMLGTKTTELDAIRLKHEIDELQVAILNEAEGSTYSSYLQSELASKKIELIGLQSSGRVQTSNSQIGTFVNLFSYSDNLLKLLSTNQACLQQNPGLLFQIAGQLMSVSSSFSPGGVLGAVLLGTGTTLNYLVTYLTDHKKWGLFKKIHNTRLVPAIGCAMETLTANYCKAQDAKKMIMASVEQDYFKLGPNEKNWLGLILMQREMDHFNTWVARLIAGSPPSTMTAADQKTEVSLLQSAYNISVDSINATIQEGSDIINSLPPTATQQDKNNIIAQKIAGLIEIMKSSVMVRNSGSYSNGLRGPYALTFAYDPNCGMNHALYTGALGVSVFDPRNGCPQYTTFPTIDQLREYAQHVILEAGKSVALSVARVNENNPLLAIAMAELNGPTADSTNQFLDKAIDYLLATQEQYIGNKEFEFMNRLLGDLLSRFNETKRLIATAKVDVNAISPPDKDKETDVYKHLIIDLKRILADGNDDPYFIYRSLQAIVDWDLTQKIRSQEKTPNQTVIDMMVKLSSGDSLSAFNSVSAKSGGPSLNDMFKKDIPMSTYITRKNLTTVGSLFIDDIFGRIKELSKSTFRNDKEVLNYMCLQTMSLPPEVSPRKRKKIEKLCQNATEVSIFSDPKPIEIKYSEKNGLEFEDRICEYYKYNRNVHIAERTRQH